MAEEAISLTPFEAYRHAWFRAEQPIFFETMRAHPAVFRGRFPLMYDPRAHLYKPRFATFRVVDRGGTQR